MDIKKLLLEGNTDEGIKKILSEDIEGKNVEDFNFELEGTLDELYKNEIEFYKTTDFDKQEAQKHLKTIKDVIDQAKKDGYTHFGGQMRGNYDWEFWFTEDRRNYVKGFTMNDEEAIPHIKYKKGSNKSPWGNSKKEREKILKDIGIYKGAIIKSRGDNQEAKITKIDILDGRIVCYFWYEFNDGDKSKATIGVEESLKGVIYEFGLKNQIKALLLEGNTDEGIKKILIDRSK